MNNTVKKFVELYENGAFQVKIGAYNLDLLVKAGWHDWFCPDIALVGKTTDMYNILRKINGERLKNNYIVYFKNCSTADGDLYDTIFFERVDDSDDRFMILVGDPREESRFLYVPKSGLDGGDVQFDSIEELASYLELEYK